MPLLWCLCAPPACSYSPSPTSCSGDFPDFKPGKSVCFQTPAPVPCPGPAALQPVCGSCPAPKQLSWQLPFLGKSQLVSLGALIVLGGHFLSWLQQLLLVFVSWVVEGQVVTLGDAVLVLHEPLGVCSVPCFTWIFSHYSWAVRLVLLWRSSAVPEVSLSCP